MIFFKEIMEDGQSDCLHDVEAKQTNQELHDGLAEVESNSKELPVRNSIPSMTSKRNLRVYAGTT